VAFWVDSGDGGGQGDGGVIDGSESDDVEVLRFWHCFDSFGPDFGGEVENSDRFTEEG